MAVVWHRVASQADVARTRGTAREHYGLFPYRDYWNQMLGQRFKRASTPRVTLQVGVTRSCFEFWSGLDPKRHVQARHFFFFFFYPISFLKEETRLQSVHEDEDRLGRVFRFTLHS